MAKHFRTTGVVRGLRAADLPHVRPVLEARIRSPETGEVLTGEIAAILEGMRRALQDQEPARFVVAITCPGRIVGVLGMRPLGPAMESFARGERPVEMVHAFVAPNFAGQGVGSSLVAALEERARQDGYDEMLLNSGPRYAGSGWGFFDRQPSYERRGILRDFYGPGQDAPVWAKRL